MNRAAIDILVNTFYRMFIEYYRSTCIYADLWSIPKYLGWKF